VIHSLYGYRQMRGMRGGLDGEARPTLLLPQVLRRSRRQASQENAHVSGTLRGQGDPRGITRRLLELEGLDSGVWLWAPTAGRARGRRYRCASCLLADSPRTDPGGDGRPSPLRQSTVLESAPPLPRHSGREHVRRHCQGSSAAVDGGPRRSCYSSRTGTSRIGRASVAVALQQQIASEAKALSGHSEEVTAP
jgi:hypothetical protein